MCNNPVHIEKFQIADLKSPPTSKKRKKTAGGMNGSKWENVIT
jgi:hypothetical protein